MAQYNVVLTLTSPVLAVSVNNACIPAGTTVSGAAASNALTLSVPVTCPAGTVISLGRVQIQAQPTTTALTLSYPAALGGVYPVAGSGFSTGDTLSVTAGSTAATMSAARTPPAGAVLTLNNTDGLLVPSMASGGLYNGVSGSTTMVLPSMDVTADQAGNFKPGYSSDGVHLNDYGHAGEAAFLAAVMAQIGIRP